MYRAGLRIAAALEEGELGADQDWLAIGYTGEFPSIDQLPSAPAASRLHDQRMLLGFFVGELLGELRLRLWPRFNGFDVLVSGAGLETQLAIELAASIAGGVYRCSACGAPYTPEQRRPSANAGRHHFCGRCRGNGAAHRYREKERYKNARVADGEHPASTHANHS
jgi:DNA-directed RNA polymerase subunit RPC12/RpoP